MLFIQQTLTAHFYGYILRFGTPGNHFTSVFLNWSIAIPDCDPLSSPSFLFSSSHSNSCHLLGQHPLLALFFQSTRLLDFTISKLEHNHSPTQCLISSSLQQTHMPRRDSIQSSTDAPLAQGLLGAAGEKQSMLTGSMKNVWFLVSAHPQKQFCEGGIKTVAVLIYPHFYHLLKHPGPPFSPLSIRK